MRITSVTYRRLVSFGNYENEALEASGVVSEGEDPAEALNILKAWVCAQLDTRADIEATKTAQDRAEWELQRVERDLAEARERWAKAVAFLKAHGVAFIEELPF